MSKETLKDPTNKRTSRKGNPEKEQRNDNAKIDLEKWQESKTH